MDRALVGRAGLYSWWIDDEGRQTLESSLGEAIGSLIYAGQTRATSTRSGKQSMSTLATRIGNNHLRGSAHGSTFRKTISALLLEPMGLVVEKRDHLTRGDNERVSQWMRTHLSVVVFPHDDRDLLRNVEAEVLAILDPPLNLEGMRPTSIRRRVSTLRRALTAPSAIDRPVEAPGSATEIEEEIAASGSTSPGQVRFMVPTGGPDDWRQLLADPKLHWVVGRSARTLAHAWEDANGWPTEIAAALAGIPALAGLQPVYGFPELKTPLPGGSRASQTDLMVLATDGRVHATVAIEGKVDEPFGEVVSDWVGPNPSPGKIRRLEYLADLLSIAAEDLFDVRYQLVHRAASAKIEALSNGSEIAMMLVHSWAPRMDGFSDFVRFGALLGAETRVGEIVYSEAADLWLGWVPGNPRYLTF